MRGDIVSLNIKTFNKQCSGLIVKWKSRTTHIRAADDVELFISFLLFFIGIHRSLRSVTCGVLLSHCWRNHRTKS